MVREKSVVQLCYNLCKTCLEDQSNKDDCCELALKLLKRCEDGCNDSFLVGNSLWQELDDPESSLLEKILNCLEKCNEPLLVVLFVRLLDVYINRLPKGRKTRMKRIADLDGITFLANSLRKFIIAEKLNQEVIESLIYACLMIGGVDKKFCVKMRLVGLLPKLASALCKTGPPPVACLIDLLTALCRSARNAMAFAKNESLVAYLLNCIVEGLKLKSESLRKCTELVYYLSKPKKTRLLLIKADAIPVILKVFEEFFQHRQEHSALMVCMAALGILRLLTAKNSGRKKLIETNGLMIFRAAVTECVEQHETPSLLLSELHYAVSTICLRCVPAVPLPVRSTDHVISLDLPSNYIRLLTADEASDSEEDMHIETAIMTDVEEEALSALGDTKVPRVKLTDNERRLYQAVCIEYYMGADRCSQLHLPRSSALPVDDLYFCKSGERTEASTVTPATLRRSRSYPCDLDFMDVARRTQSAFISPASAHYSFTGLADSYDWEDYAAQVLTTKSVIPFTSISFPEFYDSYPDLCHQRQKFYPSALLERVFPLLERLQNPSFPPKVVYDFDELVKDKNAAAGNIQSMLNDDIFKIGRPDKSTTSLMFESRFESGNLRKVIQVDAYEYDLVLNADINQIQQHFHSYYFKVSNMVEKVLYTFNIINCVKTRSLYNFGMQPVVFSVAEALNGRAGWVRSGRNIVYYRNYYCLPEADMQTKKINRGGNFYTASFCMSFRHSYDICYFAYHYPYTYSSLKAHLVKMHQLLSSQSNVHFRTEQLCSSLARNPVPVLTITEAGTAAQIRSRELVFISARIHPGESNASWMMHGLLKYLLSDNPMACNARKMFVFKIVPMINVDGVIHGSHRCSLSGEDLNRQWMAPNKILHPSIYHMKSLLTFFRSIGKKPFVYCDFHGHSRKKNVFMYGNNPSQSWCKVDRGIRHNFEFYRLPESLSVLAPGFCLKYCSFDIKKNKEGSGRVAAWRDIGLLLSYTMEASYGGFDEGTYQGYQVSTADLNEMGEKFIDALVSAKECWDPESSPSKKYENVED